jgi:hypothetical protein
MQSGQTIQAACAVEQPSLFDRAAQVFDGWEDPETGTSVLCINRRGDGKGNGIWSTSYHQHRCFLEGGRKILLHSGKYVGNAGATESFLLDLTTGNREFPFPQGVHVREVMESTGLAAIIYTGESGHRAVLWDMQRERALVEIEPDGWILNGFDFLCDGRHAIVFQHRGRPYGEHVQSRHILISPDEEPRVIMEADGFFCSHVQGCPGDLQLYAYDRWPSPYALVDQAIHLRSLDGKFEEPLRMSPEALRPGETWGARDHYLWTPDSRYIVSYLSPKPIEMTPDFNHYEFEWWLSATDWRTGEDLSAPYPEGRWGGHMQMSLDSRYIICAGGPGFDKLFAVDLQGLRQGWNEHIICSYPTTLSNGQNNAPFPYPWMLPDGSGVIFSAGWPGADHGIYLARWPAAL